MIILYSDNKEIKLDVKDESYSYEAIMAEDTLNLYFSYPGYLEIPVGTWCDFYGKRYSLKKDSNFKKKGERNFEYTLILETAKADAMMWKVPIFITLLEYQDVRKLVIKYRAKFLIQTTTKIYFLPLFIDNFRKEFTRIILIS